MKECDVVFRLVCGMCLALGAGVVQGAGITWIDGRDLPLEGKAFADTKAYYDRMPASLETNKAVNASVWEMSRHTSGFAFRFKTDATTLRLQWDLTHWGMPATHMPATGESGIDVYGWTPEEGWVFVRNGRPTGLTGNELVLENWPKGRPVTVYLPLYNGVSAFRLGVPEGAKVEPLGPRASGRTKPVAFYGTSITHGGCASRPGLAFVNVVGRRLDVPIVGLGFSGCGRMELEMARYLARVEAACYVLDCLWNMDDNLVRARFEPFVRELRRLRPDVPIVCAEDCSTFRRGLGSKGAIVKGVVEKLCAEGWKGVSFLPNTELMIGDREETVDTIHPNDWGMMHMADGFTAAVKRALDAAGSVRTLRPKTDWEDGVTYVADRDRYDIFPVDTIPAASGRYWEGIHTNTLNTAFFVKGRKDVTLDFKGARLVLHGRFQPFLFDDCTNITLKNVEIEFSRGPVTEGCVISCTDREVRLAVDKARFPYRIAADGTLFFVGEGWEDGPIDEFPTFFQFFDGKTRQGAGVSVAFFAKDVHPTKTQPWAAGAPRYLAREEDGALVLTCDRSLAPWRGGLRPGNIAVIGHATRDISSCQMVGCDGVTLQNVRILNGFGMGLFPWHCRNVLIDGLKMTHDEKSPGIIANHADGIHTFACSGFFTVRNSIIEGTIDDALNVHGNFYLLDSAADGKDAKMVIVSQCYIHSTTPALVAGDHIRLYRGHTLEPVADYVVKAMKPLDLKRIEIVLDRPLLAEHRKGDAIENLSGQCDLTLSNCRFGKTNTHLRFQTRGKILVEKCETELPFMLTGDMTYWFESSPCDSMTVRDTVFSTGRALIQSCPEFTPTEKAPYYHGDLVVEGCRFVSGTPIQLRGQKSVRVKNCARADGGALTLSLRDCGAADAPGCDVQRPK